MTIKKRMDRMRWHTQLVAVGVTCVFAGLATPARAQGNQAATQRFAPAGFPADPADTAFVHHGWVEFARYDWGGMAGMCAAAVDQSNWELTARDGQLDTMSYQNVAARSMAVAALDIGRGCNGDKMLMRADSLVRSGVPNGTFLALFRLALAFGQDTLARTLIDTHIAKLKRPSDRLALLRVVDELLWNASPRRIAWFQAEVARLDAERDSTDVSLRNARLQFHDRLAKHWLQMGDSAKMFAEIHAVRALGQALYDRARRGERIMVESGPTQSMVDDSLGGYGAGRMVDVRAALAGPRSPGVLASMKEFTLLDSITKNPMKASTAIMGWLSQYGRSFKFPDSAVYWADGLQRLKPGAADTAEKLFGPSFPSIRPGRTTLVVFAPMNCNWDGGDASREQCFTPFAAVRRLISQYGEKGLDVVVWGRTSGRAPWTSVLEPEAETREYARFVHEDLELPTAKLFMLDQPYRTFLDRRRNYRQHRWWKQHADVMGGFAYDVVVIGPDGKLAYVGGHEPTAISLTIAGMTIDRLVNHRVVDK